MKDWLSTNRPKQFERLFGERNDEAKEAEKKDQGLFSILSELNAAIADPQIALLDYYINAKASAGWEVVSMTENIILFRRSTKKDAQADVTKGSEPPSVK
ncbi:hypothetical protein [Novipirellula aureliae]|uniref:hypothetical protein n=1 Tax=Novipirellula aureliae TaxID=2527966 RepID=UPI0018CE9550|nr:hypothetical protein [Novipirellula aureliae]